MAVYVDDMRREFGGMKMCHMVADTTQELLEMVDAIGVDRRWIQFPGTNREHFDVCLSKRRLAVERGAMEITTRELVVIIAHRARYREPVLPVVTVR